MSAPARSSVAGTHFSLGANSACCATSVERPAAEQHVVHRRRADACSMPSAVLALPWGSRSMSSTRCPCIASAAAMFTALVVLPTPPFWLATVITRVCGGRGHCSWRTFRTCTACAASRARSACRLARSRRTMRCRRSAPAASRMGGVRLVIWVATSRRLFHVKRGRRARRRRPRAWNAVSRET